MGLNNQYLTKLQALMKLLAIYKGKQLTSASHKYPFKPKRNLLQKTLIKHFIYF